MKEDILKRLKQSAVKEIPLPEYGENWIHYEDKAQQFASMMEVVGGQAQCVRAEELAEKIKEQELIKESRKVISLVPGSAVLDEILSRPHDYEDVDLAIAEAQWGVAENGAVWVDCQSLPFRSILFLSQHLILVLKKNALVHHMAEAYDKLKFEKQGFGLFISGPSKTADIEQALVIGAHGPRSLIVFLVEED